MSEATKPSPERVNGESDNLRQVFPGLKNFFPELSAELKRLGVQGQMELASALFHGNGFVPYGPGQITPPPEQANEPQIETGRER